MSRRCGISLLVGLALFASACLGLAETIRYELPYDGSYTGRRDAFGAAIDGAAFATRSKGFVSTYAGAWIGGVAYTAYNTFDFFLPSNATVYVTAEIAYSGTTVRWGVGPISTLRAVYAIDRGQPHMLRELDQTLLDNVIGNFIEAGFIAAGAIAGSATVVEKFGTLASVVKALNAGAYALHTLDSWTAAAKRNGTIRYATLRFSLQLGRGSHSLAIGLESAASSNGIGNALSVGMAQITSMQVQW